MIVSTTTLKALLMIYLCLLLVSPICAKTQPQPDQLIELFRHGARGPLSNYDSSWLPSQYGVLTAVGMRQQYILGKVLSEKYSDLLGAAYDYNQVYMISDTTPRCIQSALVHLYGIYLGTGPALRNDYPPELAIPPYEDSLVKEIADSLEDFQALPYREVPNIVNVVDKSNAYIFQGDGSHYCPNIDKWIAENAADDVEENAWKVIFNDTIVKVNENLSEKLQLKDGSDVTGFGDLLLVNQYDNRTLPANITDPDLASNVTYAFTWFSYHLSYSQLIQRQLTAFNLVDAVLQQLANFRAGKDYNKVAFYSGHDSNVLAVLSAFNIVTEECILENFRSYVNNKTVVHPNCYFPYFASDLGFEFYNDTQTPRVEFYYNGVLIPLCDGQDSCSYDDFVFFARNATGNNTLETFYQKCGASQTFGDQGETLLPSDKPALILEEMYIPERTGVRTESLAIAGLSIVCVVLLLQVIKERTRFNNIAKKKREEDLQSGFLIIQ